jgi:hypothetical protein
VKHKASILTRWNFLQGTGTILVAAAVFRLQGNFVDQTYLAWGQVTVQPWIRATFRGITNCIVDCRSFSMQPPIDMSFRHIERERRTTAQLDGAP